MYTGTLISDLMKHGGSGRTECCSSRRITEELHEIFTMQIPVVDRRNGLHGSGIMAAAAATIQGAVPAAERRSLWTGTPEIYFSKAIDNSRLVKVEDPRRNREMKQFGIALALPVPAGLHLCLAALQGDRVRLPDRIGQA